MSTDLKSLIRFYFETIWQKGEVEAENEIYSEDVIVHNPPPGVAPGLDGVKQLVSMFSSRVSGH